MRTTVTELIRKEFPAYSATRKLRLEEHKAAQAIMICRTPAMGRFEYRCPDGHEAWEGHHSCHHRSCPQCNGQAKQAWLDKTQARLLPVDHFHVVMTLPHELNTLWRHNRAWFSQTLFDCAAASLKQMLADPRHLGGAAGLMLAEHTWGRNLSFHPHVHCLVTAGGVDLAGDWQDSPAAFLVPGKPLAALYRGKWLWALNQALDTQKLRLPQDCSVGDVRRLIKTLRQKNWHVRIGPRYAHGRGVAGYLARYVRGGPLSNRALSLLSDQRIRFSYYDHRHFKRRVMTLSRAHFLGRLLSHVPPGYRQRVRYYGLYHSHRRQLRSRLREQFHAPPVTQSPPASKAPCCTQCKQPYQLRHRRRRGNYSIQAWVAGHVQQDVEVDTSSRPEQSIFETGPPSFSFLPSDAPLN